MNTEAAQKRGMTPAMRITVTALLCVLAAAGGHWLSWHGGAGTAAAVPAPPAGSGAREPAPAAPVPVRGAAAALERAAATCETQALWEWLLSSSMDSAGRDAVIRELFDRKGGAAAFARAMALEDYEQRQWLGEAFIVLWAEKDPWMALEEWQRRRSEFYPAWGSSAATAFCRAASSVSAERMLEMMQQCSGNTLTRIFRGEYAPGFDFRATLETMRARDFRGSIVPDDLAAAWAQRDPVDAASWLLANAGADRRGGQMAAQMIQAAGQSRSADAQAALGALAQLPEDTHRLALEAAMNMSMGQGVDPGLLAGFTAMGLGTEYLGQRLLATTRYDPDGPLSAGILASIPREQRQEVFSAAMAYWAREDPTPIGSRMRENWAATMRERLEVAGSC